MKLFLSWSGDTSHKVARILRDWLPSVIQAVRPYVSSEDIDKGARWSTDIAGELEQASYGVICITRENLEAPWINFEAGALSKSIDKANVTPFLFRLKRSDVQGPLLQFQSVIYEKDDFLKLMRSINRRLEEVERLTEEHLLKTFEVWWPQLQQELDQVPEKAGSRRLRSAEVKEGSEILEEILELVRSQQRLLSSPEALLPRGYIESLLRREAREVVRPRVDSRMHDELLELLALLRELPENEASRKRLLIVGERVHDLFHGREGGLGESVVQRKRRAIEVDKLDIPAVYRRSDKETKE